MCTVYKYPQVAVELKEQINDRKEMLLNRFLPNVHKILHEE